VGFAGLQRSWSESAWWPQSSGADESLVFYRWSIPRGGGRVQSSEMRSYEFGPNGVAALVRVKPVFPEKLGPRVTIRTYRLGKGVNETEAGLGVSKFFHQAISVANAVRCCQMGRLWEQRHDRNVGFGQPGVHVCHEGFEIRQHGFGAIGARVEYDDRRGVW